MRKEVKLERCTFTANDEGWFEVRYRGMQVFTGVAIGPLYRNATGCAQLEECTFNAVACGLADWEVPLESGEVKNVHTKERKPASVWLRGEENPQ